MQHALNRLLRSLTAAAVLLAPLQAHALHFDVRVGTSHGPVAGSTLTVGVYGDLPYTTLPVDIHTGYVLFPGNFGDFEGGPDKTDDPGFQAFAGALSGRSGAKDFIGFKALGVLQQWDAASHTWQAADRGTGIRLFGDVPPAVANAYLQYLVNPRSAPANALANFNYYEAGTLFTGEGIVGPAMATIDDASSTGAFHAHLDWFMEHGGGHAASTAYMVTLQLTDAKAIGGRGVYVDSQPFSVIFNYGLSEAAYEQAFLSRIVVPTSGDGGIPPVPEPGRWALMGCGLGVLAVLVRRRSGASGFRT